MAKALAVDSRLCVGCGRCELTCSYHFFKVFNPYRAAIKVVKMEPGIDTPVFCVQCGACMVACPEGALYRDPETLVVKVNEEKCKGCPICAMACPYGAIHVDPETGKAVKCDYCGECVETCPQGALKLVDIEELPWFRARSMAVAMTAAPQLARWLWYKLPG